MFVGPCENTLSLGDSCSLLSKARCCPSLDPVAEASVTQTHKDRRSHSKNLSNHIPLHRSNGTRDYSSSLVTPGDSIFTIYSVRLLPRPHRLICPSFFFLNFTGFCFVFLRSVYPKKKKKTGPSLPLPAHSLAAI